MTTINSNFNEYYKINYKFRENFVKEDISILKKELGITTNDKILDAGCGYGRVSNPLIKEGFDVIGIDYSQHLLDDAKQLYGFEDNYIKGNFYNLNDYFEQNKFDKIYSLFSSIGHDSRKDDERFFAGVNKILNKGGVFLLEYENFVFHLQYPNLYKNHFLDLDSKYRLLETVNIDLKESKICFSKELREKEKKIDNWNFELNLYTYYEIIQIGKKYGLELIKIRGRFSKEQAFWYEPEAFFVFKKINDV